MRIYINDRLILLKFDSEYEKEVINKAFTYDDMSYVFAGGTFNSKKIKKKSFLHKRGDFFFLYSGFLKELLLIAKQFKIYEFRDERTKFEYNKRKFQKDELRKFFPKHYSYVDHQLKALSSMLKTNIGIVEAPTSAGKSSILIAYLLLTKISTIVIVNRVSLAMQLYNNFIKAGIKSVGICHGKDFKDGDIIVSTIGSIKKIPSLHKFKALVLDETHHASSRQYQQFLKKAGYPIRFGFSATPNPGDKFKWALIRQFMGSIICKIDADELIENEVIANPTIRFVPSPAVSTSSWQEANERCIVYNKNRNKKIKDLVDEYKAPTLILIRYIEHGKHLNELIPDSVFVSGIDDGNRRKEIIEDFENGNLQTIIATTIFNEGISINRIKLLIIASGLKSKVEVVQRLGRALRLDLKNNKKTVNVIDFDDYGNRFTQKHSNLRKKIYQKAGFKVIE